VKLSEAIRLGAMMKPQGTGRLLRGGRSCALGAALDAVGRLEGQEMPTDRVDGWLYDVLAQIWPWAVEAVVVDPCHQGLHLPVVDACWKLNDIQRYTREQVADWVEEQEKRLGIEDAAPVEEPEAQLVTV
jgi:hypothetical protein